MYIDPAGRGRQVTVVIGLKQSVMESPHLVLRPLQLREGFLEALRTSKRVSPKSNGFIRKRRELHLSHVFVFARGSLCLRRRYSANIPDHLSGTSSKKGGSPLRIIYLAHFPEGYSPVQPSIARATTARENSGTTAEKRQSQGSATDKPPSREGTPTLEAATLVATRAPSPNSFPEAIFIEVYAPHCANTFRFSLAWEEIKALCLMRWNREDLLRAVLESCPQHAEAHIQKCLARYGE